jgi:hypothetical protein
MTSGSNFKNQVTVSIVSHGHCSMLDNLLVQITNLESPISHIIITHNLPTNLVIDLDRFPFQITVIENNSALGFGANHNQAFQHCLTEYFCVLNPDVEFLEDPFNELLTLLEDKNVGIVAPFVVDTCGSIEDSYRKFPTPILIFKKALFGEKGMYKASNSAHSIDPDWVAGMFMLLRSSTYNSLNGFDEKYFLYYEDIDLCLRSWRAKKSVIVSKNVSVIHRAQRDSHRNLRFFLMHLKSMYLFFLKHWLRFPR